MIRRADSAVGLDVGGCAWYYTKHQWIGPPSHEIIGWSPCLMACGDRPGANTSRAASRWWISEEPPRQFAEGGSSRIFRRVSLCAGLSEWFGARLDRLND